MAILTSHHTHGGKLKRHTAVFKGASHINVENQIVVI